MHQSRSAVASVAVVVHLLVVLLLLKVPSQPADAEAAVGSSRAEPTRLLSPLVVVVLTTPTWRQQERSQ